MKKLLMLILLGSIFTGHLDAQKVKVVTFEELNKRLQTPSSKVVVYNFWATWCMPCVQELPGFIDFSKQYAGKNVKVVFVSLDFASQVKKVEDFVAKKKIDSEVLLLNDQDYNTWVKKVSKEWGGSIPATLVVYGPGAERKFHEGSLTSPELEQFIKPFLKQ